MNYTFIPISSTERLLNIKTKWSLTPNSIVEIKCPTWIPSRYKQEDYESAIRQLDIMNKRSFLLEYEKIKANTWKVKVPSDGIILISYTIHAFWMSPWNSYISGDTWLIQPGSICLYCQELLNEPCSITLNVPETFTISSYKEVVNDIEGRYIKFESYHEMINNPILAGNDLIISDKNVVWKGQSDYITKELISQFDELLEKSEILHDHHYMIYVIGKNSSMRALTLGTSSHSSNSISIIQEQESQQNFLYELLIESSKAYYSTKSLYLTDYTNPYYNKYMFIQEGLRLYLGLCTLKDILPKEYYRTKLEQYLLRNFSTKHLHIIPQTILNDSIDIWKHGEARDKGFLIWYILHTYIKDDNIKLISKNIEYHFNLEKIINDFVDPDVGTILLKTILTTTTQELLYKWLELSLSKDNFSIVRNDKGLIKLC
jgi:hypothetical protein